MLLLSSFFLFSCKQDTKVSESVPTGKWLVTIDSSRFWTTDSSFFKNGQLYEWNGATFNGVINGQGTLDVYINDSLIEEKEINAYYGAIRKEDILNAGPDKYIGEIRNSAMNGAGILIKSNGSIYIGTFQNSKPNGLLTLYKNGVIFYKGAWRDGLYDGQGTEYKEDGTVISGLWGKNKLVKANVSTAFSVGKYIGDISNNKPNGHGLMIYKNASKYDGTWKDGKYEGYGELTTGQDSIAGEWKDGQLDGYATVQTPLYLYEGTWEKNQPEGLGYVLFADSSSYSGGWTQGKKDGHGDYVYSNGDVYLGNWENNKRQGSGRYFSKNFVYSGDWDNDTIAGQGLLTFTNGDYYSGAFAHNKKNGNGFYQFHQGNAYKGEFANDLFNGLGIFYFSSGSRYEGSFVNGKIQGEGTLYYLRDGDTLAITTIWDGTNTIPQYVSILFSNGDLYEGEIKNGLPSKNGKWTTEAEREQKKSIVLKANDFYKQHQATWNNFVLGASIVLSALSAVPPLAPAMEAANTTLNVIDISVSVASASIDIYAAKKDGKSIKEPIKKLAKEVTINAAMIALPKVVQKGARPLLTQAGKAALVQTVQARKTITICIDKSGKFIKKQAIPLRLIKFAYRLTGKEGYQFINQSDYDAMLKKFPDLLKKIRLGKPASSKLLLNNMLVVMGKNGTRYTKEKEILSAFAKIYNKGGHLRRAQAHHIVAGGKPAAEGSRKILQKFGIDINDPRNGILLPMNTESIFKGPLHGNHCAHNCVDFAGKTFQDYDSYIFSRLKEAKSSSDCFNILDDIKVKLYKGQINLLNHRAPNTTFSL